MILTKFNLIFVETEDIDFSSLDTTYRIVSDYKHLPNSYSDLKELNIYLFPYNLHLSIKERSVPI
ncbi:hypothetical protein Anas_11011 [Armadillidium nasatum]|uniref:Uncharacterized protein n=1 Tax=Armadillidium nasatum TaxID=96803 RepID=A0A5N5SMT8_9CRUS|nr:hypothetical protein Anas_11011 [Armadillidium nasatum]